MNKKAFWVVTRDNPVLRHPHLQRLGGIPEERGAAGDGIFWGEDEGEDEMMIIK
jgi:hypothetical protein